jgi:dolichol-phosphate mannosyltransferase
VVDDNSPDGTADVVRALSTQDSRVKLIHRSGKLGLGSAVVEGFRASVGDVWVMMDADLSHRPQDLPRLLEGLEGVDVAVGSRYVVGGVTEGWSFTRRVGSRGACLLARWWLGLKVRDVTAGFAAYRRGRMEPLLDNLNPRGFKLLLEILVAGKGLSTREVPITFVERAAGSSKMGLRETLTFLRLCWRLRFQKRSNESASVSGR